MVFGLVSQIYNFSVRKEALFMQYYVPNMFNRMSKKYC